MNRKDFIKSIFGLSVTAVVAPKILINTKPEIGYGLYNLKTHWTFDTANDISKLSGIDAEAELTRLMSEYVSKEIDLSLLDDMLNTHKKCQMLY